MPPQAIAPSVNPDANPTAIALALAAISIHARFLPALGTVLSPVVR